MTTRGDFHEILLTTDSSSDRWQLGTLPPHSNFLLVGWSIDGADGETPEVVVDILVNAWVQEGRVTFPSSSVSPPGGRCTRRSRSRPGPNS